MTLAPSFVYRHGARRFVLLLLVVRTEVSRTSDQPAVQPCIVESLDLRVSVDPTDAPRIGIVAPYRPGMLDHLDPLGRLRNPVFQDPLYSLMLQGHLAIPIP